MTSKKKTTGSRAKKTKPEDLTSSLERARALGLWGLVQSWDEVEGEPWVPMLLDMEETERKRRSLERRMRNAKIRHFKPMCDFEWGWPKKIDKDLVEEVLRLDFVPEGANVILVGPNGVGKTMIAQNIAHQAGFLNRTSQVRALAGSLA